MDGQVTLTGLMWLESWSRAIACASDMFPTPFRFHIRLEFGPALSYFIRVSNRPIFGYDYAAWPERTTTNREDDRNGCVDIAGRQKEGVESGHRADREELWQRLDHASGCG